MTSMPSSTGGLGSTSPHTLSADYGLTKLQRILWMVYNLRNNSLPNWRVDPRIDHRLFQLQDGDIDRMWHDVADTASPARRLCDYFWMSMPWDRLPGDFFPVRAAETGCGTGVYGVLLEKLLGPRFGSYHGSDIAAKPDWEVAQRDARFTFAADRAGLVRNSLDGRNLLFTQSALEHFEEDLDYFRQVSEYVASADYPILQVHLVPSAACLSTFPWHGIRDYTPRTISKITQLFDDATKCYLFALGGKRCNAVHRGYVTWPAYRHRTDFRVTKTADYRAALRRAMIDDAKDAGGSASFYALVLASGFERSVF